ncbi:MAG: hypothetical protein AB7F79_10125 [Steroidobacteraceae bacterium]
MLDTVKQQSEVIDIINELTPGRRNLTGLTLSSIADWARRNSDIDVTNLQNELEDISKQIGCLHDKSNPPREKGWSTYVDSRIYKLKSMVDDKKKS